jgi:hypothetical protein
VRALTRQDEIAHDVEGLDAGGPVCERLRQVVDRFGEPAEENVLLAGEVGEDRPRRHVCCLGDVGQRGGVIAVLDEQPVRGRGDGLACPALLALAQSRGRRHRR